MLTSPELPKVSDWEWLPKRAAALQALPSCTFKQGMKYAGAVYNTTLQIRLGAITADHHHLWSECRQKGCVACPWVNKDGAGELFLHKGGRLTGVRGSNNIQGVSNLEEVHIVQPVLHNTKEAASRILGVIGRTPPAPYNHEPFQVIAHVARKYDLRSLPPDSRQHMRHVRGRFHSGINLTSREARTRIVYSDLVGYQTSDIRLLWTITPKPPPPTPTPFLPPPPPCVRLRPPPPLCPPPILDLSHPQHSTTHPLRPPKRASLPPFLPPSPPSLPSLPPLPPSLPPCHFPACVVEVREGMPVFLFQVFFSSRVSSHQLTKVRTPKKLK